jgi:hypothetical protein
VMVKINLARCRQSVRPLSPSLGRLAR